jgi:DNA topoisomerase-1
MSPGALDLETALQLLSLPRPWPGTRKAASRSWSASGDTGPYVQHGKTFANLEKDDDVLAIGDNRAIDLIVARETGGRFRRGGGDPGRALGEDPSNGKAVVAKAGASAPMSRMARPTPRCRNPSRPMR